MAMMAAFSYPFSAQASIPRHDHFRVLQELRSHLIGAYVEEAASNERLEPALLRAIIKVESSFNHRAVSPVGATGLMQLMPQTAEEIGDLRALDHSNPRANILAGAKYLRSLINQFRGNLRLAIAAYNAGPNAVWKYKGVPPFQETRLYVKKVLKELDSERKKFTSSAFSSR